jgi:hypothetical protein
MELALRDVPTAVIQQLLGHTDPRTTSIDTTAHASDLPSSTPTCSDLSSTGNAGRGERLAGAADQVDAGLVG